MIFSEEEEKYLLALARKSIENKLLNKQTAPKFIYPKLKVNQSCFVTLQKECGDLRGCIGNILPFEELESNVIHNAVNAAFKDPRFVPLSSLSELKDLRIDISVLSIPKDINSYREIKLGEDGIILIKDNSQAVFLPQVPIEQGWNLETTLTYLSNKAGLISTAWKDASCKFKVFNSTLIKEK